MSSSTPSPSLETVRKELEMTHQLLALERSAFQRERELLEQQVRLTRAVATGKGRTEGSIGVFWDYGAYDAAVLLPRPGASRAGWRGRPVLAVRRGKTPPLVPRESPPDRLPFPICPENCSVSLQTNATRLVQTLRAHLEPHGPISFIRIYQDVAEQSSYAAGLRSGLEANGVEVRDCGRWGRKDV
jgi:hypothetical protein